MLSIFGNIRVIGFVFADNAVLLAKLLEVPEMVLDVLYKEAEPLGLTVSWDKTRILSSGGVLNNTLQSVSRAARTLKLPKVSHTLIA